MGQLTSGRLKGLAVAGLLLLLTGCGTATFDPGEYQTAVQLKYETLSLLDRTGERYAARKTDAETLQSKYAAASDSAAKHTGREQIIEMWQAIRDPLGGSAGTVLQTWKDSGPLKPAVRAERKRQIAAHFDRLICLEASKQVAKDCTEVGAAPTGAEPAPTPAPPRRPARVAKRAPKPSTAEAPQQ
jgi:hypothetical protein